MKKFSYLIIVCLLFQMTNGHAHPGGHYQKGDGIILNTWRLKSGLIIKGNFSFAKEHKIFLEQEGGVVKPVLIDDLIQQDQKLAWIKINKLAELNNNISFSNANQHPLNTGINFQYLPLIIFLVILLLVNMIKDNFIQRLLFNSKFGASLTGVSFLIVIFFACSKSDSTTSNNNGSITNPVDIVIPKTNTSFIDSAIAAFKPAVATNWDNNFFYIASNGIPNHNMMIGITSWQQQVPITQPYSGTNSWSIPLQPAYATVPLSTKTNLMKGAVAIAVNGIPIFNALNNRGEDSYKIGELDNWGGHCGRGDDYHYHAAPMHLSAINGLKPIAFAVDGFPVYGAKEPDGSNMNLLDTCHGHVGTNGIYHYHGTTDYPYVVGALKGKVTLDPATTAPENQVIPQAFTRPVRPATTPLNGAIITDFSAVGSNGYLLTYRIGAKNGSVRYSWDANNRYTYILTDTAGNSVTSTYQRQ